MFFKNKKKQCKVCPLKNEENLLGTIGFNLGLKTLFSCPFPFSLVAVQAHWSVEKRGSVSQWTAEILLQSLLDLAALITFIYVINAV